MIRGQIIKEIDNKEYIIKWQQWIKQGGEKKVENNNLMMNGKLTHSGEMSTLILQVLECCNSL